MLGFNLWALVARLFNGRLLARQAETQLRRELLAHQRRQLIHARIPDVYAVRTAFGARFEELHELLVAYDPGHLGLDAAGSPLYPELARTLLYQLPPIADAAVVAALVQQEVSLWFGQRAAAAETLAPLAAAVDGWQASWPAPAA